MSAHLEIHEEQGYWRVHLNKPKKRNALDDDMVGSLIVILEDAGTREDVRSVLITAEGDHFCSGFDIVGRNASQPGGDVRPRIGSIQRRLPSEAHRLIPVLCTTQVPIVVAARGWVAGIGLHLAAAADFLVLAEDAKVWEPFSQRGFTPDSGGTWLLPRLVGMQRARELLVLGTAIDGRTAVEWGLGHRAVPAADVDATAEALARQLADGPTVSLGLTKWLLHTSAEHTLDAHLRDEAFAMELSSRSEDFKEGLKAFVEKRDPGSPADDTRGGPGLGRCECSRGVAHGRGRRPADPRGAHVRRVRGVVPDLRRVGPRRADLAEGVRRARPRRRHRPRRRDRPRPVQARTAQPARAQPLCPGPLRARHRGAAAPLPASHRRQHREVVPALQRAGRRVRPGVAGDEGRARRRRLGAHWPEGVDDVGPHLRLGRLPRPDQPGRAEARRHHLLPRRPARPRRRGPPAAAHHRRGRLQRGLPRRRAGPRRPARRRRGRRLEGRQRHALRRAPDGVGRRVGRRRPHRRLGGRRPRPAGRPGDAWRVVALQAEERIRGWTNRRLRGGAYASLGKVHQGDLNQRIQLAAVDLIGPASTAWEASVANGSYGERMPAQVKGMLRSRANTIEGGTTEVNKNVVGERVLGLPREPDPFSGAPWKDVPRS